MKRNIKGNIERKLEKYAINNITLYLIVCYAFGFVISMVNESFLNYLTLEPAKILHGQVWRLITWIIVPPYTTNWFFVIIMLLFYYSIGKSLENVWGTYRLNVYLFSGMLFTIIGSFVIYGILWLLTGSSITIGYFISTYYVCMTIFLAYATTFPDMKVYLYFILPVKVKYLGVLYAVFMLVEAFSIPLSVASYAGAEMGFIMAIIQIGVILCSLLNFIIFFISSKRGYRLNKAQRKAREDFKRATENYKREEVKMRSVSRHKCSVCGQTDESNPSLEFRYCSKCIGNLEYCQEHLFTHTHVQ